MLLEAAKGGHFQEGHWGAPGVCAGLCALQHMHSDSAVIVQ